MPKKATKTAAKATTEESFTAKGREVWDRIVELIQEGNAKQIVVEDKKGKVLFTVPVTFGVLGAVMAPWVVGLGAVAAVVGECTIKVEK